MYSQIAGTIEEIKKRAIFKVKDFSNEPAESFLALLSQKLKSNNRYSIGEAAIDFYLSNHAFSLVVARNNLHSQLSKNQQEIANLYIKNVSNISITMFLDLLGMLIMNASGSSASEWHYQLIEESYGLNTKMALMEMARNPAGMNSWWTGDKNKLLTVLFKTSKICLENNVSIGNLFGAVTDICDWNQKKIPYGPMWKDAGHAALAFVTGKKPIEMLADSLFTFCHCGGNFFEKGKLFLIVGVKIFEVLDVQRSGQIPQYTKNGHEFLKNKDTLEIARLSKIEFPDIFNGGFNKSIVKHVSQNELVFNNKYKTAWNNAFALGNAPAVAAAPPPDIFIPIDEDQYKVNKGISIGIKKQK